MMRRLLIYTILSVVFITFINALVFFGLGIYHSYEAYRVIVMGQLDNHPGIILIEALDRFLIGFVFIIFSIGLSKLFLADTPFLKNYELPWLKINDFYQMKTLLISAILVALFVAWAPTAITDSQQDRNDWTILLFPGCLVLLAIAGKFIKELHD